MENENIRKARELYEEGQYEEAHRLFLEAAEAGDPEAMYDVSWDYYEGAGVESDIMEALNWIKRAFEADPFNDKYAQRRDTLADLTLGLKALQEENYERAYRYLSSAAGQKDQLAMYNTAILLVNGQGTEKDIDAGIGMLKELLSDGNYFYGADYMLYRILFQMWDERSDPSEMIALAESYLEHGGDDAEKIRDEIDYIRMIYEASRMYEEGKYEDAVCLLQEGKKRGWEYSSFRLAEMRYDGLTDVIGEKEAFETVREFAEKGLTFAYSLLSEMYSTGFGTEQDLGEAERWLALAQEFNYEMSESAARKLAEAKENNESAYAGRCLDEAASLYGAGRYEEAFAKYLEAAGLGVLQAMRDVSILYANGIGTAKDAETAFQWMKKATEGGLVSANTDLAKMYCYGIGTPVDYEKAIEAAECVLRSDPDDEPAAAVLKYARGRIGSQEITPQRMLEKAEQCRLENRPEEAFGWTLRAAEAGNTQGMVNAGIQCLDGIGTVKDVEKGIALIKKAAEAGDEYACVLLSDLYYSGQYVASDLREAEKWCARAAELDPQNQKYRNNLDYIRSRLRDESVRSRELTNRGYGYIQQNDYPAAFRCFLEAAQLGEPNAMYNLSLCYMNGHGTDRNEKLAFEWMKKAAENGMANSFSDLSEKYYLGIGSGIDLDQALFWREKACQAFPGNEQEKNNLAYIREDVRMLASADPSAAAALVSRGLEHMRQGRKKNGFLCFKKGAEFNEPAGMHNLAVCYAQGEGTAADMGRALEWMKRSAGAKFPLSCRQLAVWYSNGYGTAVNMYEAQRWAEEACRLEPGNKDYQDLLGRIQKTAAISREDAGFKEPVPVLTEGSDLPETEELVRRGIQYRMQKAYDKAFACFEKAGKRGHYKALRYLGLMLYNGEGVDKNIHDASMFLNAAALRGDEYAEDFLCRNYNSGIYVNDWKIKAYAENRSGTQNYLQTTPFAEGCRETVLASETDNIFGFRTAAFDGNPDALCRLGNTFTKANDKIPSLTNAAIAGHSHAMFMLGEYFRTIDKATADRFYEEAAERGNSKAQAFLKFGSVR